MLDVPEMPWAFRHPLTTCLTLEVPVRRTHPRVIQATNFKFMGGLVHDFRMLNFGDGVCFLSQNVLTTQRKTKQ